MKEIYIRQLTRHTATDAAQEQQVIQSLTGMLGVMVAFTKVNVQTRINAYKRNLRSVAPRPMSCGASSPRAEATWSSAWRRLTAGLPDLRWSSARSRPQSERSRRPNATWRSNSDICGVQRRCASRSSVSRYSCLLLLMNADNLQYAIFCCISVQSLYNIVRC